MFLPSPLALGIRTSQIERDSARHLQRLLTSAASTHHALCNASVTPPSVSTIATTERLSQNEGRRDHADQWDQLRPDAGQWPCQQRGPDRHGVDDQRAFADGNEFHRHRRKSHPGENVGKGRKRQPQGRLAWDFKRLPPRLRDCKQDQRGGDAGEPAGEQRRPLLQQQLHQRPVQRPSEGRDAKAEKADPFAAPHRIHSGCLAARNP